MFSYSFVYIRLKGITKNGSLTPFRPDEASHFDQVTSGDARIFKFSEL